MKHYPKTLFRKSDSEPCGFETVTVADPDAHEALGAGWEESPANFGVETAPAKSDIVVDIRDTVEAPIAEEPVAEDSKPAGKVKSKGKK